MPFLLHSHLRNNQLVGLREKSEENPIFHGKIYGFRLRFSLQLIHWLSSISIDYPYINHIFPIKFHNTTIFPFVPFFVKPLKQTLPALHWYPPLHPEVSIRPWRHLQWTCGSKYGWKPSEIHKFSADVGDLMQDLLYLDRYINIYIYI